MAPKKSGPKAGGKRKDTADDAAPADVKDAKGDAAADAPAKKLKAENGAPAAAPAAAPAGAAAAASSKPAAAAAAAAASRDDEIAPETDTQARNKEKGVVLNPGFIRRPHRRILVTGGAGFIGSHMCDFLLAQNDKDLVICVDNCFSGNKSNIAHLLANPRFEFIRHDVTQPLHIQVDQIYHLACPASPVFYQHNGIETIKTGVLGTMNMLDLANRVKARFLISSTSEVYGDPKEHPQKETYWGNVNPIGIRSCYDEGKRLAESLCFEFWRVHNVQVRVARIFNTYGPRMLENDGRVVSNFIVQALTGTPITIYGDGTQTRSFCYVADMCRALHALMNGEERGPINLGNPNEKTISELADAVTKEVGTAKRTVYKPVPSDDPCKRKPDITLAQKHLGWSPRVSLEEGLKLTVADFRARYEAGELLAKPPAAAAAAAAGAGAGKKKAK